MSDTDNTLNDGSISVNLNCCRALVGKKQLNLTATEYNLLVYLLENSGISLTREELLEGAWAESYQGTSRTVDTHVRRLRLKLGRSGRRIRTVRGVGYQLESARRRGTKAHNKTR